jgi:hypothetical protein
MMLIAVLVYTGSFVPAAASNATTSQAPTQTSIQIPVASASTSNSSLGVQLVLQLSTSGPSGGNLTIRLGAVNLRNSTNVVPYADKWAYDPGSISWSDGCALPGPLAFGVFNGNLTATGYKDAQSLALFNTNIMRSCTETLVPTSLTPLGNKTVGSSTGGYWTGGYESSTLGAFTTFPPGTYSVMAEDEWGQILLLQFAVTGTTTTTTTEQSTTPSISVQVNGTSFAGTSPILISGNVDPISPRESVLISVANPSGTIIVIADVPINSSLTGLGAYSFTLTPSITVCGWLTGTYTVTAEFTVPGYNTEAAAATANFVYSVPASMASSASSTSTGTCTSALNSAATTTTTSTITATVTLPTATVTTTSTSTTTQTAPGQATTLTIVTTSTQTVTSTTQTSSSTPSWAYATMAVLLIAGLAVGYAAKRSHPQGASV